MVEEVRSQEGEASIQILYTADIIFAVSVTKHSFHNPALTGKDTLLRTLPRGTKILSAGGADTRILLEIMLWAGKGHKGFRVYVLNRGVQQSLGRPPRADKPYYSIHMFFFWSHTDTSI